MQGSESDQTEVVQSIKALERCVSGGECDDFLLLELLSSYGQVVPRDFPKELADEVKHKLETMQRGRNMDQMFTSFFEDLIIKGKIQALPAESRSQAASLFESFLAKPDSRTEKGVGEILACLKGSG